MAIWSNSRNGNLRYSVNRQNASGIYIGPTRGLSSPKNDRRGCLCVNEDRYGRDCCGGALISQGIGVIQGTQIHDGGAFSNGYDDGYLIEETDLDIVRDGLLYAYDYFGYTPGDANILDKSGNGLNAPISGTLGVSDNGLVFNGSCSLHLPSGAAYLPWEWTYQTFGTFEEAPSGSNNNAAYPNPRGVNIFNAGNTWKLVLQQTGSANTQAISMDLYINDTNGRNTITNYFSGMDNLYEKTITYTGEQKPWTDLQGFNNSACNGTASTQTGSLMLVNINEDVLPVSGANCSPIHANEWGTAENDMWFGKGVYEEYLNGTIQLQWQGLKGDVKYILVYDRPLTSEEIAQNDRFFRNNKNII